MKRRQRDLEREMARLRKILHRDYNDDEVDEILARWVNSEDEVFRPPGPATPPTDDLDENIRATLRQYFGDMLGRKS